MATAKTKSTGKSKGGGSRKRASAPLGELPPVLTLAEAAAYLHVSDADVQKSVAEQNLPGRKIGSEWRFLKAALELWLGTAPKASSKEALLSMAGAWKDDPFLDEIVQDAYRRRGRPIIEEAG